MFLSNRLKNWSKFVKPGYTCTFSDPFQRVSWEKGWQKWNVGERWGMYHPQKPWCHYGPPKLTPYGTAKFSVKYNPKAFILTDGGDDDYITVPYEASLLTTHNIFQQQHGRFECRCTLPTGKAVWPSFWLYGDGWPPEIDVFETYGKKDGKRTGVQEINLHYGFSTPSLKHQSMGAWPIRVESQKNAGIAMHEFVVEWNPDRIDFITDGILIFTYRNKEVLELYYNVPTAKMGIVIGHGVTEHISKYEKDFYSEFFVDYIRVYQPNETRNHGTTNPG